MSYGKLKLVNTLFIIIFTTCFRFCIPFKPFISSSPEIWLASFQQSDSFEDLLADPQFRHASEFENEFVSKFNKTDYIVQDDTRQVVFICEAKYPVTWSVPHFKHVESLPFEIFTTESVRKADFLEQIPRNQYFRSSLTIRLDGYFRDVFSVNFTCGRPNTYSEQQRRYPKYTSSSIHIYYSETQQAIEHFGDTIQLKVPINYAHNTFTIPCRPALPSLSIKLEKEVIFSGTSVESNETKRTWKAVQDFTYDPKYGFTVGNNAKKSIFGLYRCCISEQDDNCETSKVEQVVLVNLTLDTSKSLKPTIEDIKFEPSMNLKGNALLMYSDHVFGKNITSRIFPTSVYNQPDIWCCSGVDTDRPVIYRRACTDPLQCDLLKRSMTFTLMTNDDTGYNYVNYVHSSKDPDDCIASLFYDENSVIFCKGQNVQFGDYLIKLFSKDLLPISGRKELAKPLDIWTFEPESSKAAANISRRMFLTVGHSIKISTEGHYGASFIEFRRSRETQYTEVIFDYWDEEEQTFRIANIGFAKSMQTQYVVEYNRDNFYVGEPLIAICLGWLSFYSHGAYVRIVYSNGTNTILNFNEAEEPYKYAMHFSEGLKTGVYYHEGILMEYKFGKQVIAHKDMKAFECWMPQWNTEKWDMLKFELNILEPTNPRFLGSGDVNETSVYFDLRNDNQTLEWRIQGGSPEPKFDVAVDGKKIYQGDFTRIKPNDYQSYHIFDNFNLTVERDRVNDTTGIVRVKILFIQMTHGVQGIYQCKVTNVGGTVTQSFKVIVTENGSIAWVLIMVLTVCLVLVFIFTGLIYKYWKQTFQR